MSYVKFLLLEVDHPIAGAGVYLGKLSNIYDGIFCENS